MPLPITIVYEDNHLLIVNKEPGVLSQGDSTRNPSVIDFAKQYVKEKYNKPGEVFIGLVNRLDRPVSGLVVLARTSKGLERMNELFRKRDIQKVYWAIVKRKPPKPKDRLEHWLSKDEGANKATIYDYPEDGAMRVELSYRTMGFMNDHYLLEVTPVTGRPHQIRAQLAHIGCPIRGDIKYGFARPNYDQSIHLHARRLFFVHPIKNEKIVCTAGVPRNEFWEQFLELDDFEVKNKNLDFNF